MSKELEALNYIEGFSCFDNGCYKDKLDAIRKTLVEKEAYQKKVTELIALYKKLAEIDFLVGLHNKDETARNIHMGHHEEIMCEIKELEQELKGEIK